MRKSDPLAVLGAQKVILWLFSARKVILLFAYKSEGLFAVHIMIQFEQLRMEQAKLQKFFKPADPNAQIFSTPSRTRHLQPMLRAPKAKRSVGRPRKRPISEVSPSPQREASPAKETPPPQKRIRASYSMKKYEVVQYAIYQACQQFNLSTGTVGPWMSLDFSSPKGTIFRASGAGRKLSYPEEKEVELVQWVLEQRDLQLAVTVQNIIDQAVVVIQPTNSSFKGTRGWAQKFMRRNDLVIRAKTSVAQKLPAALEQKMTAFLQAVREARVGYDYPKNLIGNMDETPMYFDMPGNTTIEKKGTKTISVRTTGAEKRHLTVVLAATADGQMLPPMVIFKGKRNLKNITVPK